MAEFEMGEVFCNDQAEKVQTNGVNSCTVVFVRGRQESTGLPIVYASHRYYGEESDQAFRLYRMFYDTGLIRSTASALVAYHRKNTEGLKTLQENLGIRHIIPFPYQPYEVGEIPTLMAMRSTGMLISVAVSSGIYAALVYDRRRGGYFHSDVDSLDHFTRRPGYRGQLEILVQ